METVKGFRDYIGEDALKREKIKEILVKNFKLFGFNPEETPVIEQEEFVRGENANDEAVSDVFKLRDKGDRNLALRYEFTFQLKRTSLNKKLPYKRYQIDIVGSNIKDEAEILALTSRILKELKIDAEITINNRKLLNAIIKSLDLANVEFILREIDKIDKQGEGVVKETLSKSIDGKKIKKLFAILNSLNEIKKFPEYKEIEELINICKGYGVELNFNPLLARGLAYYNGSVYEIKTKSMKETVCAGGSYLVNGIQSTGLAFGLERVCQLAKLKEENKKVIIISIGQDKKAVELAEKLRENQIPVSISEKISKGLEYANAYGIKYAIFLGEDEVKKKKFKLRDMKTGKEDFLKEKELITKLISF
jgi:histidyl-tRNA synthetase